MGLISIKKSLLPNVFLNKTSVSMFYKISKILFLVWKEIYRNYSIQIQVIYYYFLRQIISLDGGNQTLLRMFDFIVVIVQYFSNLEFDQIFKILQKFVFQIKFENMDESTLFNIFEKVIFLKKFQLS